MRIPMLFLIVTAGLAGRAAGQDYVSQDWGGGPYGAASFGAQEQLFPYDDQEPWKHGYRQVMPYYGGWHKFRPYNYHHVFGQTQAAAGWGMPLPYSQQFWHRYQAVPGGNVVPLPQPTEVAQPFWTPPSLRGDSPPAALPPAAPVPYSGPAYGAAPAPLPGG